MDLQKLIAKIDMLEQSMPQSTRPETVYAKSMLALADVHINLLMIATEMLTELKKLNSNLAGMIETRVQLQQDYTSPRMRVPPIESQFYCTKCQMKVHMTVTEIGGEDHAIFQCKCSAVNEGEKTPEVWTEGPIPPEVGDQVRLADGTRGVIVEQLQPKLWKAQLAEPVQGQKEVYVTPDPDGDPYFVLADEPKEQAGDDFIHIISPEGDVHYQGIAGRILAKSPTDDSVLIQLEDGRKISGEPVPSDMSLLRVVEFKPFGIDPDAIDQHIDEMTDESNAAEPVDEDQLTDPVDTGDHHVSTSGVNQAEDDGLGEFDTDTKKD